jgi:hypothetical protein
MEFRQCEPDRSKLNREFEMLDCMEDGTCRPGIASKARGGCVPLRSGPKWIAWITSDATEHQRWRGSPLPSTAAQHLLRLEPANVTLKQLCERGDGYLAMSGSGRDGTYRGYAHIGPDRTLEMAGVLGAGVWGDAAQSWWPGAYELPMLRMLSTTVRTLLDQLMQGTTPTLYMALTDIAGTAIVSENEGMERPFLLPSGMERVDFRPVRLNDSPSCRAALTASFNTIREIVGIGEEKPFYL